MSDQRGQSKPRAALAAALDDRRAQLRLKWTDVATRAGLSIATINRARRSDAVITTDVKIAIEDALRLQRGSIDAKLAGGELSPQHLDDPKTTEGDDHAAPLVVRMSADELAELIMTVQDANGREEANKLLAKVRQMRAEWAAKRANPTPEGDQSQAG